MTEALVSSPHMFYLRRSQRIAATNYGLVGRLVFRVGVEPRCGDVKPSVERIQHVTGLLRGEGVIDRIS